MSTDKRVVIIAGGQIEDPEALKIRIDGASSAPIICADGGARHARAMGLIPDMIIGDLDSMSADLLGIFSDRGVDIRRHPPGKDETDTELAFEAALEFSPSEILVVGALGYRLDHTLANLSLLLKGEARQIPVKLIDEWCEIFLVTATCTINGEIGQTVSLLPFFGVVTGVSLTGFAYPLEQGRMSMERPFGVSNRLTAETATITVASGRLLVIRYFRKDVFPS